MGRIVIADSTNHYDGRDLARRPLGGTETSVIQLAEALARRGHEVACRTNTAERVVHNGVTWTPLGAERAPKRATSSSPSSTLSCSVAPRARPRRLALWVVWPPTGLPPPSPRRCGCGGTGRVPCSSASSRRATYPRWLPGRDRCRSSPSGCRTRSGAGRRSLAAPPPRAVFASNPQRDLRWLLDLWGRAILPAVPDAELHLYGIRDYGYRYGEPWDETESRLGQFLPGDFSPAAPGLAQAARPGHPRRALERDAPGPRHALRRPSRPRRSVSPSPRRRRSACPPSCGRSPLCPSASATASPGSSLPTTETFARRAVALLTDDGLWRAQHEAALRLQQGWSWDEMAARFEAEVIR